MKTYSVTYRRDHSDDAWLIEIEGMPDVFTFGRTLEEAAANAREAVAVTVDASESEVQLEERFAVGGIHVDDLAGLRKQAQEIREACPNRQRAAALRLAEAGVSHQDSARMLGVSQQRVQQLVAG